jgi:hypothetical protein
MHQKASNFNAAVSAPQLALSRAAEAGAEGSGAMTKSELLEAARRYRAKAAQMEAAAAAEAPVGQDGSHGRRL